jgi:hypothetical protein
LQITLPRHRALMLDQGLQIEALSIMSLSMDHHVYFWLKDEYQNDVDRAIFEQGLAALLEIDLVASGRWAVPAKVAIRPVIDQSWDYALTMQFKDIGDHDIYQDHPDHHTFINTFKEWWAQVQVKDLA